MNHTDTLSFESVLVQQEGHIVSDMDGEKVMLNIQNGKYYNLGEVGGEIWAALATPSPVSHVVDTIMENFEVSAELAKKDVLSFLQHLLNENLIEFVGQS